MKCWLVRLMISSALDERRELGSFAARHIEKCESCRSFHAVSAALAKRLSADAAKFKNKPLFRTEPAIEHQHHHSHASWKTAVVAGVCALLVLVASLLGFLEHKANQRAQTMSWLAASAQLFPSDGTVVKLEGKNSGTEMGALAEDTKGALGYIVDAMSLPGMPVNTEKDRSKHAL